LVNRLWRYAPFLAWPLVAAVALAFRVPIAIDETRYLTVAWEMFSGGDWLVPHLNGEFYTHKPPLLFWLINAGWTVFGVNAWWPRLVPHLAVLAAWGVLWRLARRLWPQIEDVAPFAVIFGGGTLLWSLTGSMIMFDMLLALWVLVGMLGLAQAGDGEARGWLLFGAGLGLGILTKGPVALLHLLLPALLGPWWSDRARQAPRNWYLGLLAGFALGALVALAWVVPAALAGGAEYREMILWKQTADRVTSSFAHREPFWWYLPVLPLLCLPWILWRPLWDARRNLAGLADAGTRFCLAWAVPVFLAFCAISGKQPQYLLPLTPALALIAARAVAPGYAMSYRAGRAVALLPWLALGGTLGAALFLKGDWHGDWLEDVHPAWTVGVVIVLAWAILPFRVSLLEGAARLHVAVVLSLALVAAGLLGSAAGRPYAVDGAAREVGALQAKGHTVGYYGNYHGQFGFAGRLRQPVRELWSPGDIAALAAGDPGAVVVLDTRRNPLEAAPQLPSSVMRYRTGFWSIWSARQLAGNPGLLDSLGARGPRGDRDSME
jgi:4-amino-4-deoxy-L-arabinose transferase-like glycosyltransferase